MADEVPVVCKAAVDYSAVNEYARAHYGLSDYFDDDVREQRIYDGRALQARYRDAGEMLRDNGLAIVDSPLTTEPKWSDLEDVRRVYLPELEKVIREIFLSPWPTCYCFWNPMIRGESHGISRGRVTDKTPTAGIASLVHIDTDVGAHESIGQFLGIVEKNRLGRLATPQAHDAPMEFEDLADLIHRGGRRFAVLNFWRNAGDAPVARAPLAVLSTRYAEEYAAFPDARPDMAESRWYVFPNATRNELIVFYQYDRNCLQPSDLFHCAISVPGLGDGETNGTPPPRTSFDVRAILVLDEVVSEREDRFGPGRTRPVLTLEESGCFCDEQAAKRT